MVYDGQTRSILGTDQKLAGLDSSQKGIEKNPEDDRYPHAPRLDPLKSALGKLEAAAAEPTPPPETPPSGKVEKRAR
jgi:hypothetical protein